jgi:hypothetical protein
MIKTGNYLIEMVTRTGLTILEKLKLDGNSSYRNSDTSKFSYFNDSIFD